MVPQSFGFRWEEGGSLREIYRWVEDIAFYSVLLVLVMHVLPAGEQKKYVRFFMGLLFMLLVFGPILRWTGQEQQVTDLFLRTGYEQELEEFLQEQRRLERDMEAYTQELLEKVSREEELIGSSRRPEEEETVGDGKSGNEKPGQEVAQEVKGRESENGESGRKEAGSEAEGTGDKGGEEGTVEPVEIRVRLDGEAAS